MILSLESNSARCFSKEAYRPGLTSCSMFSGCWGDARPIFQSFFVTLWGNLGRFLVSTSLAFHPKDCWGLSTRINRVHLHVKIRAYFGGLSWEVLWISDVLDASLLDYFEIWPPVLNLMGVFATSPHKIQSICWNLEGLHHTWGWVKLLFIVNYEVDSTEFKVEGSVSASSDRGISIKKMNSPVHQWQGGNNLKKKRGPEILQQINKSADGIWRFQKKKKWWNNHEIR